ncbi:MAG: MFS transporter, partial [Alphaproteobacteria bacterium]
VGPPVGGFLTTYFSWRWIFWINLPMGILGIVLATLFIADTREEGVAPLDVPGFLLTALGLTGVVFGFEAAGRSILPNHVVALLLGVGAVALRLYVLHARRAFHPIIDLSLLRIPTFRASVAGSFLFRIGIGASPFLLPLMFQEGFGLDPLHSGMLTFASAAGALTMKFTAGPILRRFGFRPILIGNALLGGALLAASGLFRQTTPGWLILAVLLIGGFFRSLQFTSMNVIAYAELPTARMSKATSFTSMAQQLSASVGVGIGALMLHLTLTARGGDHLVSSDFWPAFLAVGGIASLAALVFLPLPLDSGAELSGRRPAAAMAKMTPAPDGD